MKKIENPLWVTLEKYSQAIEAHVVKSKLESEGIECFIADEHVVGVNWLYSNAIGGVKVQVHPEDLEEARKILQARD
jgi:hypothetical protein